MNTKKILICLIIFSFILLIIPNKSIYAAAPNLTPMQKGGDAVLIAIAKKRGINFTDPETARKFVKGFEYKTRGNVIYPNFKGMKVSAARVPSVPGYIRYTISAAGGLIIADTMLGLASEFANSNMELITVEYPENITDSKGNWVATEFFYSTPIDPYQGWPPSTQDETWKANIHRIHYYDSTTDTWKYHDQHTDFAWVGTFRFTGLGQYWDKSQWSKYGQDVYYQWNSYAYLQNPYEGNMRLQVEAPFGESANVLEYDTITKEAIIVDPIIFPDEDFEIWIPDPSPGTQDPLEIIINNPEVITNPNPALITNPNTEPVIDYTGEPVPQSEPEPNPNEPDPNQPKPDPDDWSSKMKVLVTTKFPFSLPWDLYNVLSILNADPVRPDIHVDKTFMNMPFKFDITFEFLDPYMPFFRAFIVIAFCMFLITSTRKLLGGST